MKRNPIFSIVAASILAAIGLAAAAQAVCRALPPLSSRKDASMEFVVTRSTPHADDCLVRVAGNLVGRPHTSNRIDGVLLINGRDTIAANDIDGVDFQRYFQWEDDGVIPLEIDFPGTKAKPVPTVGPKSVLIFKTVNGDYKFTKSGPCK